MKKVLDIGQCDYDHGQLTTLFKGLGATLTRAITHEDGLEALDKESYDLILVNRICDANSEKGLEFLPALLKAIEDKPAPVMLITNYPEVQEEAQSLGAEPGFGKAALDSDETKELLKRYLD